MLNKEAWKIDVMEQEERRGEEDVCHNCVDTYPSYFAWFLIYEGTSILFNALSSLKPQVSK
jgi:hypothetical protein